MFQLLTIILLLAVTSHHAFDITDRLEIQSPSLGEGEPNKSQDIESLTISTIEDVNYYKSQQVDALLRELRELRELQANNPKLKELISSLERQRDVNKASQSKRDVEDPVNKTRCNCTFKSGLSDVIKTNLNLHKKLLHLEIQNTSCSEKLQDSTSQFKLLSDTNDALRNSVQELSNDKSVALKTIEELKQTVKILQLEKRELSSEKLKAETSTRQNLLDKVGVMETEIKAIVTAEFSKVHNSTEKVMGDLKKLKCPQFKKDKADLTLTKIGVKYYYFSYPDKKTWTNARDFCRSRDMQLLSVETEQEHQLIQQYIIGLQGYTDTWTSGKSDSSQEGTWMWTATGQNFTLVSHSNLSGGGSRENCLEIRRGSSHIVYHDYQCSYSEPFICEAQEDTCE